MTNGNRKHHRQISSFKSGEIADEGTTNPLQSVEKKARSSISSKLAPSIYFKSDWTQHDTCFKANNIVSPIVQRSQADRRSYAKVCDRSATRPPIDLRHVADVWLHLSPTSVVICGTRSGNVCLR